jgi:hypothetical protein
MAAETGGGGLIGPLAATPVGRDNILPGSIGDVLGYIHER